MQDVDSLFEIVPPRFALNCIEQDADAVTLSCRNGDQSIQLRADTRRADGAGPRAVGETSLVWRDDGEAITCYELAISFLHKGMAVEAVCRASTQRGAGELGQEIHARQNARAAKRSNAPM